MRRTHFGNKGAFHLYTTLTYCRLSSFGPVARAQQDDIAFVDIGGESGDGTLAHVHAHRLATDFNGHEGSTRSAYRNGSYIFGCMQPHRNATHAHNNRRRQQQQQQFIRSFFGRHFQVCAFFLGCCASGNTLQQNGTHPYARWAFKSAK